MKTLFVATLILFTLFFSRITPIQAQPASAPTTKPQISAGLRSRIEAWDWFAANGGDGSYTYVGTLLRLSATGQVRQNDWQIELAAPWLANLPTDAQAPAPEGPLGLGANYRAASGSQEANLFLKQGFLRIHNVGSPANALRLGRFEFVEGLEGKPKDATLVALKRDRVGHRLLGNFGWSHVGRSLDGLQFSRDVPGLNLTLLAARPTRGVFDVHGWDELDAEVYYAAATHPLLCGKGAGEARLFWLLYDDHRDTVKVDNRPAAVRTADQEDLTIHTVGGHLARILPAGTGTVDVLLWGAAQFGKWGEQDHRAGALAAEAGYQPKNAALRPWIRGGVNWGSGDKDPADGDHDTFFQVLPTPRIYARFPFYNMMNTTDWFLSVTLRPPSRWTLRADYHRLSLSRRQDLWYQGGGAFQNGPAFGYVGRPSGGETGLAHLFDLSVDYVLSPKSSLTFYAAHAGGRGVVESIYPGGKDASLFYLEINQQL